jgi:2'-5' RNA ligase
VRLFVVLELPHAWREAAVEVRSALDGTLGVEPSSALRWVQPGLLHVTLRFLGEFPDTEVARLQDTLDRHVGGFDLGLGLGAVGRFGPWQRTQVVWLGVDGDVAGLRALAERVERACLEAGAAAEARAFQPHITLARVRERTSPEARRAIAAAVDALEAPAPSALRAREVALVRSTLGGAAPRYDVLSRHGGPPPLDGIISAVVRAASEEERNLDVPDRSA